MPVPKRGSIIQVPRKCLPQVCPRREDMSNSLNKRTCKSSSLDDDADGHRTKRIKFVTPTSAAAGTSAKRTFASRCA